MSLPIGPVSPPGTATTPLRTALHGRDASLVPLTTSHASSLYSHLGGSARNWTYMPFPCPEDITALTQHVTSWVASTDPLYFAVVRRSKASSTTSDNTPEKGEEEALGIVSYLNIVPEHRRVEIGWIMFGDAMKRIRIATEVFYLLMSNAFENLGYLRVEWKCDSLNQASRDAAARLGFTYEGTFRQHNVVKGRRRDSSWFSVIQDEWPAVKKGFERWLDDDNFDEEGKQKKRLHECREA